jgi:A/G-specific adenine glycosylase
VRADKRKSAASNGSISRETKDRLVRSLLSWFAQNARDLPWRHTRDPYAIWVSEIMLQQTQVKTVIPYWSRWIEKLPTIQSLARARLQTIHKLWEGLGYYARVRHMQKAARVIVDKHGGEFPRAFGKVLELPGIGRYTAGAVCSIAFNQPRPILDGNVARVLTRIFALRGDPREKATNAILWDLAEQLVTSAGSERGARKERQNGGACSALNQSLMELGALICTPKQPKCNICPVVAVCGASRQGLTASLPEIKARPPITHRRFAAFVLSDNNQFLVRQRPSGVVNAHLWEFPNLEVDFGNGDMLRHVRATWGEESLACELLCTIKHSITRYRIALEVYRVIVPDPSAHEVAGGRWMSISTLHRLPFTSAHKKILKQLPELV